MAKKRKTDPDFIPDEVKVVSAYKEYLLLKEDIETTKWYQTSVEDLDVNLCALPHRIEEQIQDLEDAEERQAIMDAASQMRKNVSRMGVLKRKAFGLTRGKGPNGQVGVPKIKTILSEEKQAEVLELFGAFYSAKDVHRIVVEDWGFDLPFQHINKFRNNNLDKIYQLQEEFKRDFGHLRLGHKRARLEELTWLYEIRRMKFEQNDHNREDEKLLKQTIEQIKREVEGDKVVIDGKIELDIKQTINMHTQKEIMGRMNLLTIVVSRIAARGRGINPIWMMTKLANSYYAKFSGMQPADDDLMKDEVLYPNNMVYNFDDIERMHENMKLEQMDLKRLNIDITPEKSKEALSGKDKLKMLLERKKETLKDSQKRAEMSGPLSSRKEKLEEENPKKPVGRPKGSKTRKKVTPKKTPPKKDDNEKD